MKKLNPDFQSYFSNLHKSSTITGSQDTSIEGSIVKREYTNSVQEKRSNQIKNPSFMKVISSLSNNIAKSE